MRTRSTPLQGSRQNGATLITTMVILVLIMLLGVSAMRSSETQFRLSGNIQFEDTALNRAEAALAAAEHWLIRNDGDAGFIYYSPATSHLHPIGHLASLAAPDNNVLTMVWNNSNSLALTSGDDTQRYVIERISMHAKALGSSLVVGDRSHSACNTVNTYLITARGTAARGATKWVQSYFAVPGC